MFWNHLGHINWTLFYWPGGIVVGNLIANVMWETPSQIVHAIRLHKHQDKIINHINDVVGGGSSQS